MNVSGKKVWVGLSGGVDSAVSAALLQKAGATVTGVFLKGWYPPGLPCSWASERRDAMRVAAKLQIPFLTIDASQEYKASVIDYLLREYRAGRTPNPDVFCNRDVKFGVFYRTAKAAGADFIATGHYRSGEKDQSYFLWAVPKEALDHTLFPIGHFDKAHVRSLAKKFDLPVADKKDSQGVCFLGDVSVEDFLKSELHTVPGSAVDESGVVVGTHQGVELYTLGQRVALEGAASGPWFVLEKRLDQNKLVVGKRGATSTPQTNIRFSGPNWLTSSTLVTSAQYRYRGPLIVGRVEGDTFVSESALPERVAPGQSLVFYHRGTLAGGATIEA